MDVLMANLPLFIVLFIQVIGPIAYFVLGRGEEK